LLKFNVTWPISLSHTLKHCVTKETKLACIKHESFVNVPLGYFENNFLK
jgi:hypothetical protein